MIFYSISIYCYLFILPRLKIYTILWYSVYKEFTQKTWVSEHKMKNQHNIQITIDYLKT